MTTQAARIKTGLAGRTASGTVWLMALQVCQKLISLVQTIILARLLDPRDFGLMGIALLALRFCEVFTHTGFEYALVQKPDLEEIDLHTAWWILLGRRLMIGMALFLFAGPVSVFFHEPNAIMLLRVMSLGQVISGFVSLSLVLFQREIEFNKYVAASLPSAIAGLLVSVGAALLMRNVWALVVAWLVQLVVSCVVSYMLHPYRPKWHFNQQRASQLVSYGQWIFGSAILFFVVSQGADTFSGWMFGATALGLYQMAAGFALLPSSQFGEVILSTVFPSYAKIQQEPERLKSAFLRVLGFTVFVLFPSTAMIGVLLPPLFSVILGSKWIQAAPLLPAIAFAGLVRAFLRTGSPLFLAMGRPNLQFLLDAVAAAVMVILFYPLGRVYGLQGLALASALGAICTLPVWWWGIQKTVQCSVQDVAKAMGPVTVSTLLMTGIMQAGIVLISSASGIVAKASWTIGVGVIGGFLYLVSVFGIGRFVSEYNPIAELEIVARRILTRSGIWQQP